jgi:hypothetical protein
MGGDPATIPPKGGGVAGPGCYSPGVAADIAHLGQWGPGVGRDPVGMRSRSGHRRRQGSLTWASFPVVDEHYERMRARLLAALADHERGILDHPGLQAAIADLNGTLGGAHSDVREALFEADVALEYARFGHPTDGSDPGAALKRVRRNLREVLG